MPKQKYKCEVSWQAQGSDPKLGGWSIYGNNTGNPFVLGARLGIAEASARSFTVTVEAGTWDFRVVPRSSDGSEKPWNDKTVKKVTKRVDGSDLAAPPAITLPAAGPSEPTGAAISFDPHDLGDSTERVQVIDGPDENRGKLIGLLEVTDGAVDGSNVPRGLHLPVAMTGYGQSGSRTLKVRGVTVNGAAGSVSSFTSFMPDRDDAGLIEVASAEADGASHTLTNFPAIAGTDRWESDITDGYRLKAVPDCPGIPTEWDCPGGYFSGLPTWAKYLTTGTIESDQVDLGGLMRGELDIWDTLQRKDVDKNPDSRDLCVPVDPVMDEAVEGTKHSAEWLTCLTKCEGGFLRPRYPLLPGTNYQWYYKIDTVDPITTSYVPYTPGAVVKGRYLRVKLEVEDHLGLYQLIVPDIWVRFRPKYQFQGGSDTVTGGVATKTVTLAVDRVTGNSPYLNRFVVQVTERTVDQKCYVTTKTATTPSFVVTHRTVAGTPATPGSNTDFDYLVWGY